MFDQIKRGKWWDRTWGLVRGCTKVSRGCRYCWLEKDSLVHSRNPNLKVREQFEGLHDVTGRWNGEIRENWEVLNKPTARQKPAAWAIWSDLFHEKVSFNFQYKALERMYWCPQHLFIACTKRPEVASSSLVNHWHHLERNGYPVPAPNFMLMVSIEDSFVLNKRIDFLCSTRVAFRALSLEPLFSTLDLTPWLKTGKIHWVVIGGETGRDSCSLGSKDYQDIDTQCLRASTPLF